MKSKRINKIIILSVFLLLATKNTILAQIDTTDYFPLQTGNYWELTATSLFGPYHYIMEVVGDTLMNNDKTYKTIALSFYHFGGWFYDLHYIRKDSNYVYRYYGDSIACTDREYKYFDFEIPDSMFWERCGGDGGNARGLVRTYYSNMYYIFLQKPLESKLYWDVWVDSADTIWLPNDASFHINITKGIGITRILIPSDGEYFLHGAIINGVKYGTFVGVQDEKNMSTDYKIKAYPNPFNSIVNLLLSLPNSGFTEVSIYNLLGQKIKTILKEFKSAGNFNISYNANGIGSGIYLIILKQNQFITKGKIILLK